MTTTLLLRALSKAQILLFSAKRGVYIGPKNFFARHCRVDPGPGGHIRIGSRNHFMNGVLLMAYGGSIDIGDMCNINPYAVLYGHQAGLSIGNNVLIAAHGVLIPANHGYGEPNVEIWKQPLTSNGIVIEDDVWLGAGVKVLDGVRIGHGSVIGAGSVVTKSVPPMTVAAGVPARLLKQRA